MVASEAGGHTTLVMANRCFQVVGCHAAAEHTTHYAPSIFFAVRIYSAISCIFFKTIASSSNFIS